MVLNVEIWISHSRCFDAFLVFKRGCAKSRLSWAGDEILVRHSCPGNGRPVFSLRLFFCWSPPPLAHCTFASIPVFAHLPVSVLSLHLQFYHSLWFVWAVLSSFLLPLAAYPHKSAPSAQLAKAWSSMDSGSKCQDGQKWSLCLRAIQQLKVQPLLFHLILLTV